ncbi:hypothetical protein QYM36_019745 [Artemia franciscana]|uniref:Craniofacial development protein 2-like n=1 Tax=Artemia franciscana TaxID=6661 RepID=A0AA88H1N4_ARTSF|nr:hypothetical protein QYM36_019745 [Artemia franciscana]
MVMSLDKADVKADAKLVPQKLSIAACYTPTNKVAEIENDDSYEKLKSVVATIPRHNITSVVGDLNVKVGSCHKYYPKVMGQHGMGDMNENALLMDFTLNSNFVIGRTLFQYKTIYEHTDFTRWPYA